MKAIRNTKKYLRVLTIMTAVIIALTAIPAVQAGAAVPPPSGADTSEATWFEIAQMIPVVSANGFGNRTVNPNSEFSFTLSFDRGISAEYKHNAIINMQISFPNEFELLEGVEMPNSPSFNRNYPYRVRVPAGTAPGRYFIRCSITYSYDHLSDFEAQLNNITNASSKIAVYNASSFVDESKNFTMIVTVSGDGTADTGARIDRLNPPENVKVGETSQLEFFFHNETNNALRNSKVEILQGNTVLFSTERGTVPAGYGIGHNEGFPIPAFSTSGNKNLTLRISYTENGVAKSVQRNFTLRVAKAEETAGTAFIDYLNPPQNATVNKISELDFLFKNDTKNILRNAKVEILQGNTVLTTLERGTVAAGGGFGDPVIIPAFTTAGNKNLVLRISYTENGTAKSVQRNFTLSVGGAEDAFDGTARIDYLNKPDNVTTGEISQLNFLFKNDTKNILRNVRAEILQGSTVLSARERGTLNPGDGFGSDIEKINIPAFATTGNKNLTLRISYTEGGVAKSVQRNFTLAVAAEGGDGGALKFQNITPPLEVLVRSRESVSFFLTNATDTAIRGAEAFLLDSRGTEVDSVFISKIDANTSQAEELSFVAGASTGVLSYTIRVIYKDANGVSHTLNRAFSVNAVSEKTEDPAAGRPASMRIQKIGNPAIMYSSVDTDIPYTLVNAGKGTAFNVEVYITDADGNEIVREYIGNIGASEVSEGKIKVRFDLVEEYELYLYVVYENANETENTIKRSFNQTVVEYRASVTDMAGFDWLMPGEMANIEFSVLNNGTETLRNVTAELKDSDGNVMSEIFVGTIEPGTKKERLRFRNVMFLEAGHQEMTIMVTYENESMRQFKFSNTFNAMIQDMSMFFPGGKGDDMFERPGWGDDGMFADTEESGKKIAWWVLLLIGCGIGIPGLTVLFIFLRKRAVEKEGEEMERYVQMLAGGGVQPIPEQPVYEPMPDYDTFEADE